MQIQNNYRPTTGLQQSSIKANPMQQQTDFHFQVDNKANQSNCCAPADWEHWEHWDRHQTDNLNEVGRELVLADVQLKIFIVQRTHISCTSFAEVRFFLQLSCDPGTPSWYIQNELRMHPVKTTCIYDFLFNICGAGGIPFLHRLDVVCHSSYI